jgi:peroxiredoxin
LAAFQDRLAEFREEGISLVAGSIDPPDEARRTVDDCDITYPVVHSLPLLDTAATLTTFYETRRSILHATGFVVRPDRTIGVACYSTGPIGRLVPEDVLRLVTFWKKKESGT